MNEQPHLAASVDTTHNSYIAAQQLRHAALVCRHGLLPTARKVVLCVMDAQKPTFMLLPDFGFAPDQGIHLGTLLPLSPETKLPDPDLPLNESERVAPLRTDLKRYTEHTWRFNNDTNTCWSAGVEVDIPVFLPAGGGLSWSLERKNSLSIECERLETIRFMPSAPYIAQTLAADFVREYCRKTWRPSVYLVTGLKIAEKAVIRSDHGLVRAGKVKAKVDGTSFGVPLSAGPTAEVSKGANGDNSRFVEGPFVLAYQLKRLRLSRRGEAKAVEPFNKFALFDDAALAERSELLDSWDMDDVLSDTVFEN